MKDFWRISGKCNAVWHVNACWISDRFSYPIRVSMLLVVNYLSLPCLRNMEIQLTRNSQQKSKFRKEKSTRWLWHENPFSMETASFSSLVLSLLILLSEGDCQLRTCQSTLVWFLRFLFPFVFWFSSALRTNCIFRFKFSSISKSVFLCFLHLLWMVERWQWKYS